MRRANLSFIGLYTADNTLFENMLLPDQVVRETLVHNLLLETAGLEVLYPDSDFMKSALEMFSKKQIGVWNKLYETTQYEYDPIYNYDRYEQYTDTESVTGSEEQTDSVTGTTSISTDSNAVNKVAGYNAGELVESGSSGSDASTATETESAGTSNKEHSTNRELTHEARLYGNIGVTTTQQMIEAERDVVKFNIYNAIIDDIKTHFCLLIY